MSEEAVQLLLLGHPIEDVVGAVLDEGRLRDMAIAARIGFRKTKRGMTPGAKKNVAVTAGVTAAGAAHGAYKGWKKSEGEKTSVRLKQASKGLAKGAGKGFVLGSLAGASAENIDKLVRHIKKKKT